jgi:hypothetical protein
LDINWRFDDMRTLTITKKLYAELSPLARSVFYERGGEFSDERVVCLDPYLYRNLSPKARNEFFKQGGSIVTWGGQD